MMKKILMCLCTLCISWNASAFDLDQIQIHGFASQGYLRSNRYDYLTAETEEGTVEFNEFGFNIMSSLGSQLHMGIQLLARDLGDGGNDTLAIDWAFGDYHYRNWLGIRFGKLKKAFGLYNQIWDIDVARNGVFLPLGVYNEQYRIGQQSTKGVALYGTLSGGFEYQIQYGTMDPEFEKFVIGDEGEVADDGYVLHLVWNAPLDGLKFVGAYMHESWTSIMEMGPQSMEVDFERNPWIVGVEYAYGNVTFAAEYTQAMFDMSMEGSPTTEWATEAYYGMLNYRFTDWLEVGTSYCVTYQDTDDREGRSFEEQGLPKSLAWTKDLALTTRFDLNEYWVVKLEGHWFNGLNATTTSGGLVTLDDYGDDPSENTFLGAVKVTFRF